MIKYTCETACDNCVVETKVLNDKKLILKQEKTNIYTMEQDSTIVDTKIKFIDLFAGTGAFTLALERNDKFKCVFANDMIESSKYIYELNHITHPFTLQDLNTIDVSDIPSHLYGGFPCQPFSIAGDKRF